MHFGEGAVDLFDQRGARFSVGHRLDMDDEEAFGDADGRRRIEQAVRFRIEMQHRMRHEADDAARARIAASTESTIKGMSAEKISSISDWPGTSGAKS